MELTHEQQTVIDESGQIIVSASAGSGKTFVMIQKIIKGVENGDIDLDCILAVTFTKKAAAQMKEKLRSKLIKEITATPELQKKQRLKAQLAKIPSADISTIHSFCAKLIRTYFYAAEVDGTFGIMSADDAVALEYQNRAIDNIFEKYYENGDEGFKLLLKCYGKKRSDKELRKLVIKKYKELRIYANYKEILEKTPSFYTDEGYEEVCAELDKLVNAKYMRMLEETKKFEEGFSHPNPKYAQTFKELKAALEKASVSGAFVPPPKLPGKPQDRTPYEKEKGEVFGTFKKKLGERCKAAVKNVGDKEACRGPYMESGKIAIAFAGLMKEFDAEYDRIKKDENKLDYNDLEHITLKLLEDKAVKEEIRSKYTHVFIDEYQDVNPVQESILSNICGNESFRVGDAKQAIYGFRGSQSKFFSEELKKAGEKGGKALTLSSNFRSAQAIINFVNAVFTTVMTKDSCGINYADKVMEKGADYKDYFGEATIHYFGKEEKEKLADKVYSVLGDKRGAAHSREALAILKIVEDELCGEHYDIEKKAMVKTMPGDICILTRKNNRRMIDIMRTLVEEGYSVSSAKDEDLLIRPEAKQLIDILSYIDNSAQDVPLVTALLSPLGNLSCDDLATIKLAFKQEKSFSQCCKNYSKGEDGLSKKLRIFYERIAYFKGLTEILTAAEIIDKLLEETCLEAIYSENGGQKLRTLRVLAREGEGISVFEFLAKIKSGYKISAPAPSSSDSIKIMTMHTSKGLEFPVVIISDICAEFKGDKDYSIYYNEKFGFAPKCYDRESKVSRETVLRVLTSKQDADEELKNELNLFYVACTRAQCKLHVMASKEVKYNPAAAADTKTYAQLFDMESFNPVDSPLATVTTGKIINRPGSADDKVVREIENNFTREYGYKDSLTLPVKSSASAILKSDEEEHKHAKQLFEGEGETGTDRGTAYHRFLQLCKFDIKDEQGIEREIEGFVSDGLMPREQAALLSVPDLAEIVNMPVFKDIEECVNYREQEFLCTIPANKLFTTNVTDGILVQGAIDLLVKTEKGYRIIDYKYSLKSDEGLIETYSKQLAIYKTAVAAITGTAESDITTDIVNIYKKRQIPIN